jgi:Ankyrin repeats (3 copies)
VIRVVREEMNRSVKFKRGRASKVLDDDSYQHQRNEDVMSFDESFSSNIIFDENHDEFGEGGNMEASDDSASFQDLRAFRGVRLSGQHAATTSGKINRHIKEDAIDQFDFEESMAKLVGEDEVFHRSVNMDESVSSLSTATLFHDSLRNVHHPTPLQVQQSSPEPETTHQLLFNLCSDTASDQNGNFDPSKWERVRDYMLTNPDRMPRAAQVKDKEGRTALHHICLNKPPLDIIELFVSCSGLDAMGVADRRKLLPIHYACMYSASTDVVNALTQLDPRCITQQDLQGGTPLHYAIANENAPIDMIEAVCSEAAASLADCWGRIPLHLAASKDFVKPQVIKFIMSIYPRGLSECDLKGRAPVHALLRSCHMESSVELFEFALALDPALGKGDMGHHLLIILKKWAENHDKSPGGQKCLDILLMNNSEPSEMYIKTLKSLPRWLKKGSIRKHAFSRAATKKNTSV